ncbi:hypothetical protein FA09DRAFT_6184 [Tilletiopsis washingtonensis]|uniref:Uncharacterized protein n=1 Tax=Tilletiopsis washingtonensis TaxID=58919 RepID=A0A316ZLE2_9BASI|nr:hypothetical protein FA09DRAFT_6184 [Tilletiopsis washingtonensis]PWO01216.1 hypothetical protein FA09DRAFT_6184 [Tilletiopsis washingtonensis]
MPRVLPPAPLRPKRRSLPTGAVNKWPVIVPSGPASCAQACMGCRTSRARWRRTGRATQCRRRQPNSCGECRTGRCTGCRAAFWLPRGSSQCCLEALRAKKACLDASADTTMPPTRGRPPSALGGRLFLALAAAALTARRANADASSCRAVESACTRSENGLSSLQGATVTLRQVSLADKVLLDAPASRPPTRRSRAWQLFRHGRATASDRLLLPRCPMSRSRSRVRTACVLPRTTPVRRSCTPQGRPPQRPAARRRDVPVPAGRAEAAARHLMLHGAAAAARACMLRTSEFADEARRRGSICKIRRSRRRGRHAAARDAGAHEQALSCSAAAERECCGAAAWYATVMDWR